MQKKLHRNFKALWAVVRAGDLDALNAELALAPELALHIGAETGESLLVHAIRSGQAACALALIPLSKTKSRTKNGELPLTLASQMGMAECVAALIPLSSPVAAKDGFDALATASLNGHAGTVNVILEAQPHWALAKNLQGKTPLLVALTVGQEACSNLLLPHSDCSTLARGGESVLFWAARAGFGGIVKKVLSLSGARKVTTYGWTPLMAAASSNQPDEEALLECVEALLPLSDTKHKAASKDHWSCGLCATDLAINANLLRVASHIASFEAAQKERKEIEHLLHSTNAANASRQGSPRI